MKKVLLGLFIVVSSSQWVAAFDVPEYQGWVTDIADVIPADEEAALNQKLESFSQEQGVEVAILTLPDLDGYAIEEVGIEVAEAWKVGRDEIDSGILVLMGLDERQRRIETGYGIEGNIPDILAARMGRNILVPAFREGDYAGGFDQLIDTFGDTMKGVYDGTPIATVEIDDRIGRLFMLGFLSIMAAMFLRAIFGDKLSLRKKASSVGPGLTGLIGLLIGGLSGGFMLFIVMGVVWSMIMLTESIQTNSRSPWRTGYSGGGWSGGRGGGSFGGGFSGFGGGSFGGGGASGAW